MSLFENCNYGDVVFEFYLYEEVFFRIIWFYEIVEREKCSCL